MLHIDRRIGKNKNNRPSGMLGARSLLYAATVRWRPVCLTVHVGHIQYRLPLLQQRPNQVWCVGIIYQCRALGGERRLYNRFFRAFAGRRLQTKT